MSSWADRAKLQKERKDKSTLKVQINHKNDDQKTDKQESRIPLNVRFETEPNSEDDMIMYRDIADNDDDIDDKEAEVIPDERFVLNHFNITQKGIFFDLTLQFLDMDDTINLLICYRKYAQMFKGDDKDKALLRIWKYLYQRDYGKINFHKKRRCKRTREEQLQKHQERLSDYKYWKQRYKVKEAFKYIVKVNNNKLTYYRKNRKTFHIDENHIIIVSTKKSEELWTLDALFQSNWYDVVDKYVFSRTYREMDSWEYYVKYGYDNWQSKRKKEYREQKHIYSKIDGMRIRIGYKDVKIDTLMQNIFISSRGTRAYVYDVQYIPFKCYLVEIMSREFDMENMKCSLLSIPEKYSGESAKLIEGMIYNRILDIGELRIKMLECSTIGKQLKVMVYAMDWKCNHIDHRQPAYDQDLDFVVVDYYD